MCLLFRPVEWIPISSDNHEFGNDGDDAGDSTSDTSSDSSEDEGLESGQTTGQGASDFNDIDEFLETEVKEEAFDDDLFTALDDFEVDWSLNCSLTCRQCKQSVEGFEASIQHAKTCPQAALKNSKAFVCICCPKSFTSKDVLKNHVKRHVFSNESNSDQQPQEESSAVENQYWNCQRCESKAFKGKTNI